MEIHRSRIAVLYDSGRASASDSISVLPRHRGVGEAELAQAYDALDATHGFPDPWFSYGYGFGGRDSRPFAYGSAPLGRGDNRLGLFD